jgi:quinol---cytochrome c reductase cytochrome c subunit, bacillus type
MAEKKNNYEAGLSSDARKDPQRIVFITKKTSAKVRGDVGRQLMSYPHIILREAVAFEILIIILVAIALFWNAPLEQLANPLVTPNPAKAPWYFLGLQELLHYFPPVVAGILIPGLVVVALVGIPYFNVNIKGEPLWAGNRPARLVAFLAVVMVLLAFFIFYAEAMPWDAIVPTLVIAVLILAGYAARPGGSRLTEFLRSRPISWWVMTWFIFIALSLTLVGTFLRGPGWSLVWPWR